MAFYRCEKIQMKAHENQTATVRASKQSTHLPGALLSAFEPILQRHVPGSCFFLGRVSKNAPESNT